MKRAILCGIVAAFFFFTPRASGQTFELTCPAGSTSIQSLQSFDQSTGKLRQNYCIDANGNVFENVTGGTSVKSLNGSQFCDQYPGADAWVKIIACMAANPGGTVYATGFTGLQVISSVQKNTAVSNVKVIFGPNVTFQFGGSGCNNTFVSAITFTGNDVELAGGGWTTVFDFSFCPNTGTFPYILSQGNRPYFHDFKIIGNRVQTSSTNGVGLQLSSVSAGVFIDSPKVEHVNVTNSGQAGVYVVRVLKAIIRNNYVFTPSASGILIDGNGNTDVIIDGNFVFDPNVSNTGGASGIGCVDQGTIANGHKYVAIINNHVTFTGLGNGRGSECDSTEGLTIAGNYLDGNRTAGEQISFTSHNVNVYGNTILNSSIGGILFFVTTESSSDVNIGPNIADNNGSYCVQIGWGAANVTVSNIHIHNNKCTKSGTGTQNIGVQFFGNGQANAAVGAGVDVTNNQLAGVTSAFIQVDPAIINNSSIFITDPAQGLIGTGVGAGTGSSAIGITSQQYYTFSNCAVNSISPAACGSATSGTFAVPATTTTYTVNSARVTSTSRIFLQNITDNSGIPGSPTCTPIAAFGDGQVSARVAGVSFTISLPSTGGTTCFNYWIIN